MAPGLFDDSWLNKLALFGLTHLQAKIYVSIYILGEVPVRAIVDFGQMHKVEVYRVLEELEDLGVVDRIIAHPVRYRARQPEEVVKNLLIPNVERLARLGEVKSEVLDWFHSLKCAEHDKKQSDDCFELLKGKFVLRRVTEMLARAATEVLFISCPLEDVLKSDVLKSFNRAVAKGIRIRVVLRVEKQDADVVRQMRRSRNVSIRHSDGVYSWIVIVDGREIVFGSAPSALPDEKFLYTRNRRFIHHYIQLFKILYQNSQPVEEKIQEIEGIPQMPIRRIRSK